MKTASKDNLGLTWLCIVMAGVLEELAAEGFKVVAMALRNLQSAEAEAYAAEHGNAPKARGWTSSVRCRGLTLNQPTADCSCSVALHHSLARQSMRVSHCSRFWTLQTLEAALLDGLSLLLAVERENGASRLAMLLQGGTNGISTGRRMGGGASQAGALAEAAARQPLPVVFASTTSKVSRCRLNYSI